MARSEHIPQELEIEAARDFFAPRNFGFEKHGIGWKKVIPGIGSTIFTPLNWEHAHFLTNLKDGQKGNGLELASQQQERIFGMRDHRDIMPPYLISNIAKTGGSAFVAYTEKEGFTDEGWLGFGFVFGGKNNSLESTFLGVREKNRSKNAIGFHLRLLQSNDALENGSTRIEWMQGPLRGEIAKLSINKLGGTASTFTIDKYRDMKYKLYGPGTTDRITVEWNLLLPRTQQKIIDISQGVSQGLTLEDIQALPIATGDNIKQIEQDRHSSLLYEIPAYADELEEEEKIAWRDDMRKVFGILMDTEYVKIPADAKNDPALVQKIATSGSYQISDFATGFDGDQRRNFYVLTRKSIAQ
ncbi:hypothetical protein [Pseudomonas fluorescens]|uniref:Uncharacterized protein n=1 Tax=Pseudomonas fluorescens TaxID=294 RepID=A0A5E7AW31_PSEFL|nr:hypothetical protein [Pseudomonas fluorescens]VVN83922.1 hypothetical protein PS691_01311 [Pseudomonas fluorescens]